MKLKQIQLQGFKSFVNRTVLSFTDNITLVVGPNGCGKSNLVDAIRWTMGEQSAKHLRGGSMEDVIFHGSDSNEATGMAEATLIFDNADGTVGGDYSRFSEIQVTRRLFRSGESEYYINRTPCRLKDITDIFLGSGAGTKAYSIVEQGRIEEIITMKPEQRRIMIEEAAGVSKYRVRKQEAERKIESTRQNLLRIRDIVAELKRQMNSLNRQAKKAERYKEYRDQLKEVELSLSAFRAFGIRREEAAGKAKLEALQNQELTISSGLETAEAELEQKRAGQLELERDLGAFQLRVVESSRAVEKEENAWALRVQESKAQEASRGRLAGERQELLERESGLAQEMSDLEHEVQALEATAAEAQVGLKTAEEARAWKEKEYRELGETAEAMEKQLAGISQGVMNSRQRIEWSGLRKKELEEKIARDLERRQRLESSEEAEARANLSVNEKIYSIRKGLAELREVIAAREREIDEARTARAIVFDRIQVLQKNHARVSSRLESLREMEKNFEGYQRGVKSVMARKAMLEAQGKNGTYGLLADVIKVDKEYELALEAVLGERLQSIVVRTRSHGLDNIHFLQSEGGGKSSFAPIEGQSRRAAAPPEALSALGAFPLADKVQVSGEYAPMVMALIGDALVVPELETAAQVREQTGAAFPLVTREGVLYDERGVLVGGSPDSFTGFLGKKREIGELAQNLNAQEQEREREQAALTELDQRLETGAASLDELKDRYHRLEIEKNNLEKDLRQGTERYNGIHEQIAAMTGEAEKTQDAITALLADAQEAQAKLDEDQLAIAEVEKDLMARRDQLTRLNLEREAAIERCTAAQVKVAALHEKLDAQKKHLGRLERGRSEVQQGIEKRREEQDQLAQRSAAIAREMEEIEARRQTAAVLAKELSDQLEQKRLNYERESAATREREGQIKALYRQRDDVKTQRMEADLLLSQLKVQWEGLGESIRDKYSREIEELLSTFGEPAADYSEELRKAEREELRQKLERMGDVNLTALEEYQEISERYSFLTNQEADLIQALENLELTIGKINSAYKVAFKQTYEEVNEKFQVVFPRLFNGGKAFLQLTDPEDFLESGIEIMAQPPGKRMNMIVSLSGGEKALTATSLIIALYQVRPSPFCLLDEVDAALDDINVLRFNEIVKELAHNSQLIIITHNRKTMEIADAIYGVTMEQKGVSKLVSVRFQDEKEPDAAPANP